MPSKITLDKPTIKLIIASGVISLGLGASLFTAAINIFPESKIVRGIGDAFIGSACKEQERYISILEQDLASLEMKVCFLEGGEGC